MLGEEYKFMNEMKLLERKIVKSSESMSQFNTMDIFYQKKELDDQLTDFLLQLEKFNMYLPYWTIRKDYAEEGKWEDEVYSIEREMKLKFKDYIKSIDHSFGLNNFDYVMKNVRDQRIKAIYS
jgi:hypothetical protein